MQYVELLLKSDSRIEFWNVRENPSLLLSGSLGRVNMGVLLKFVNYEQTYIISFKRGILRATITEYLVEIYRAPMMFKSDLAIFQPPDWSTSLSFKTPTSHLLCKENRI